MNANLDSNRRRFARGARRVLCQLVVAGEVRRTFALDLSPAGIFLQLSRATAELPVAQRVTVILEVDPEPIKIEADVARIQKSHRAVTAVQASGVGLTVVSAPEAYFKFLMELC